MESPKTSEYEITVPLRDVFYKNKFYNLTTAVDYMQMHLNYYSEKWNFQFFIFAKNWNTLFNTNEI